MRTVRGRELLASQLCHCLPTLRRRLNLVPDGRVGRLLACLCRRPCADSDKQPNASFVAAGDDGTCAWACNVWLFRAVVDGSGEECVPCINAPASGATYVSAGEPADADACQWACEASYALNSR